MSKLRIATAIVVSAAGLLVLAADPAAAKGPRGATIEGPGLDGPIEASQAAIGNLPALTGLYGALWTDPAMPLLDEAPTTDLGPAWVITWDMGEYSDATGRQSPGPELVRQTVYPDAAGGPLVHTEPGQPLYEDEAVGGWYEAPAVLTSDMLSTLGEPADIAADTPASGDEPAAGSPDRAELASSTRAGAESSSDTRSTRLLVGAVAFAALLATAAVLRIRRRPAG